MNLSSWGINKSYQAIAIRQNGSIDFNMTWEQSKVFRGNEQEMWMGLEDLHNKCGQSQSCELLILFTTRPSSETNLVSEYILCSSFYIDDENGKFKNHISQWYKSGNANFGAFTYHNNRNWSTIDSDNDDSDKSCSQELQGPNWYGGCANNTIFGPFNGVHYYGISIQQADSNSNTYNNLDYLVLAVREFGTGQLSQIQKGKYSTSPGVWLECDYTQCKECFESPTNCTIYCNQNCDNTGCNSDNTCKVCKEGFYKDNNNQCVKCDNSICATCQNEATTCILECNEGCQSCKTDQTCIDCKDGFYQSGSACIPCNNLQCATCINDANSCVINCQENCGSQGCNIDSTCKDCINGYYLNNSTCDICDVSVCATCKNIPNNCILNCLEGCSQCNSDQSCTGCKQGYYDSGSLVCTKCNFNCATCSGSADSCDLLCVLGCGTQGCDPLGKCINCQNGFYLDSNQECQECDYTVCAQCSNSAQECTMQCTDGCNECNIDRSCKLGTGCKDGFFQLENGQCQKCDSTKCRTCNTSADNCIEECPSNCGDKGCNVLGVCQNCITGQFLNQLSQQCQECSSHCQECQEQADQCTKCYEVENELRLPPFCVDLNTVSFENQINSQNQNSFTADMSCNGACRICENTTQLCQQCRETFILHNDRCVCSSAQEIVSQKCMNLCQEDEYRDQDTLQCMKCKYYQNLCFSKCPLDTIFDTTTNTCQKLGSLDLMLIYIIAGIGFVLILISLVYNHKSKSLDFKYINQQESEQNFLKNQNQQMHLYSNQMVLSQQIYKNEQKKNFLNEVTNIPNGYISTNILDNQLDKDQKQQSSIDNIQKMQLIQSQANKIKEQQDKHIQQQEQILTIQDKIENNIQKEIQQKSIKQSKKRRKSQKNLTQTKKQIIN